MKRFILILLVAVMAFTMFACGKEATTSESSLPDELISESTPADTEEGIGGDNSRWIVNRHSDKLTSIRSPWRDYIFEQTGKYTIEWWDSGEWCTDDNIPFSLIEIIDEVCISKEKFTELNNEKLEQLRNSNSFTDEVIFRDYCFTDEEIDIIYSGDKKRIAEAFAFPYAVVADNWELYPLRWIIDNPATLYKEREISLDAIQKSVDKIIEDGLVKNADKEALLARIEEYKELL